MRRNGGRLIRTHVADPGFVKRISSG